MATLYCVYESMNDAENAIERLLAAGVPATGIDLIMGEAVKDSRDAPIGTFAGTTNPDAEIVGSYANIAHSGREAMGTFAGVPDQQRRGAFSDFDRDTVTTYRADVKRTRIASHRELNKILIAAGLDRATATADVEALHAGRILVLVQRESAPNEIAAVLDDLEQGHCVQQGRRAAA